MNTAIVCGLIIAVVLLVILLMGAPISIAIGISSIIAILPVLNIDAALLTGAQRTFSGISVFTLIAIPFFILAGNIMNKGGIAMRLINLQRSLRAESPALLLTQILLQICFSVQFQVQVLPLHQLWVQL